VHFETSYSIPHYLYSELVTNSIVLTHSNYVHRLKQSDLNEEGVMVQSNGYMLCGIALKFLVFYQL
jgi:hypothetical protein